MSTEDGSGSGVRGSERAIHQELRAARKRPGGLSPHAMAQCPVMCDLLGNGDPEVALVELNHKIMELIDSDDDVMAIEAASYSLGLCTYADTHLARLEEFGAKHFLDQRQARRYSDRGLLQLARLISSHWTTQTVPEATLILIGLDETQVGFTVQSRCQRHIHMRKPTVSLWQGEAPEPALLDPAWTTTSEPDALWQEQQLAEPVVVRLTEETTIRLVWRGETWPKFTVVLTSDLPASMVKSETLGAACAVTALRTAVSPDSC